MGAHAFPFYFEVPPHCPASVSLQPAPGDTGKPCGVDYELKAFVGEHIDDKPHKRNSVRLAIRKIMYAPSKLGEQPSIEVSKEFMLKPNKIHLEASLDKEVGAAASTENRRKTFFILVISCRFSNFNRGAFHLIIIYYNSVDFFFIFVL